MFAEGSAYDAMVQSDYDTVSEFVHKFRFKGEVDWHTLPPC